MIRQQRRRPDRHHNVARSARVPSRGRERCRAWSEAAQRRLCGTVGLWRVCWSRASCDAQSSGAVHDTVLYRRPSSRVAGALVFVVAVLLMLAMISIAANAQTLGNASTQPNAYPADEVIASDEGATPGAASPRRRRLWHDGGARHHHHRYRQHHALLRARPRPCHPLRRRRRPRRLHLVRACRPSAARRNGRTGIRRPR